MGLLSLGTPLTWEEAKKFADHVRSHGITQFLHTWDRLKDRCGDELLWGDEVILRDSCATYAEVLMPPLTLAKRRSNIWSSCSIMKHATQSFLLDKKKSSQSLAVFAMTYPTRQARSTS